jgi:simple sugar transport system permease protein
VSLLAYLLATLRISVPYAMAALGGVFAEGAGVVSLHLEGLILGGAFATALAGHLTHSAVLAVLGGVLGGVLLGAVPALLVLGLGADAIVSGVALNLLVDGLTRFLLKAVFGSASNSPRIDAFGPATGAALVGLALALVALGALVLLRTPFGLRVRAVGEHPEAAQSMGIRPRRVRLWALLVAGGLGGLGGAWLAADQHQFVAGMSSGRGYIAIAAMILGGWHPLGAAAAALLFGAAEAAQIALQTRGLGLPGWLVQMLPYVVTLFALSGPGRGLFRRVHPPAQLGKSGEP